MQEHCPACSGALPTEGLTCPQCGADVGWYVRKPDGRIHGPVDRATLERLRSGLVEDDKVRLGSEGDFVPVAASLADDRDPPPSPLTPTAQAETAMDGVARVGGWAVRGALVCGVLAILWILFEPVCFNPSLRAKVRQTACMSNLKQIAQALQMYAASHDGRFPPGGDWEAATAPYVVSRSCFTCPSAPKEQGYMHNPKLNGSEHAAVTRPADALAWWDAGAHVPGLIALPSATSQRHNGGDNFAYVDGHGKWSRGGPPVGAVIEPLSPTPATP